MNAPAEPAEPNLTEPKGTLIGAHLKHQVALHQPEVGGQVWVMQRHLNSKSRQWRLTRPALNAEVIAFASLGAMVHSDAKPYRTGTAESEWIWCGRCGKVSFNVSDVRARYCGQCQVFFD